MTNVVQFHAQGAIPRQAREWLIRLDRDEPLADAEVAALREWLRLSPSHRQELIRISAFWKQANVLTELAVPLRPRIRRHGFLIVRGVGVAVAVSAVVGVLAFLCWSLLLGVGSASNGTYATTVGVQKTELLADGSMIQLNTDSRVQVDYDSQLRRVRLLRGEVLFTVVPDRTRPFEVYAADSIVRAVGTAFAVHLAGNKVDVIVTKGAVDVADGSTPIAADESPIQRIHRRKASRLRAGEATILDHDTEYLEVHRLGEPELRRRMAWQEGYLVFSGEPLNEVIEQVNRYSPVTLELGDPKLASIAIGGRFRIGDLQAVLEVLQIQFGIQSRTTRDHNIRLEPAPVG